MYVFVFTYIYMYQMAYDQSWTIIISRFMSIWNTIHVPASAQYFDHM